MIHGPFIQPGHLFELVGVSSQLDELQHHNHDFTKGLDATGVSSKQCFQPISNNIPDNKVAPGRARLC